MLQTSERTHGFKLVCVCWLYTQKWNSLRDAYTVSTVAAPIHTAINRFPSLHTRQHLPLLSF